MFGLLRKGNGDADRERTAPSLDSVTFDTRDLKFERQDSELKVWYSVFGDGIGLYFFNKPPNIPPGLQSLDELRSVYVAELGKSPGKIVEFGVTSVAGCSAVRLIVKAPQRPSGLTYVGSITLPFRQFSYVFKSQCEERGTTGIREAILFDRQRREGKINFSPDRQIQRAWNPDATEYDSEFPQHPLSRLRQLLRTFEETCVVESNVNVRPKLFLPAG